jgi:Mrp family chromosome partitioning ATPase
MAGLMSTGPEDAPTPLPDQRRRGSSPSRRGGAVPIEREAPIAGADGRLTLLSDDGAELHVSPPSVTRSVRYMLGRMHLGDQAALPDRLGLIAAMSGEGTTFLCHSLALALSNDTGRRVCVVDMNWASPSSWYDGNDQAGLADVLRGDLAVEDVIVTTGNPGLSLIPAGGAPPTERPLLANSPALEQHLVDLGESFDHLIVDLPAVHSTSEALALAKSCAGVALVVNQGVTPDHKVKSALEQLAGIPILGVILNRTVTRVPRLVRRLIPAN